MVQRIAIIDQEQVGDLFLLVEEIWREVFTKIIGAQQVERMLQEYQSPAAIWKEIQAGVQYFALVQADGKWIGYTAYSLAKPEVLYISKLYLHESVRGQGLMREIFAWYDKLALETGRRQQLRVNRNNANAIAVYEHQGFKIITQQTPEIAPGLVMEDYIFEK